MDKNAIQLELLAMDGAEECDEVIECVDAEITLDDIDEDSVEAYLKTDARILPTDRLFRFCTPPEFWAGLYGRMGYIVVRDGRIHEVIDIAIS